MGACFSSSPHPATAADGGSGKRRRRDPKGKVPDVGGGDKEATATQAARVEFGYERDFEGRYQVGRLLGHGQFGYTFAATDRTSGDRVAVKRIDKAKTSQESQPLPTGIGKRVIGFFYGIFVLVDGIFFIPLNLTL